jgi:hypothetical protein
MKNDFQFVILYKKKNGLNLLKDVDHFFGTNLPFSYDTLKGKLSFTLRWMIINVLHEC